MLCSLTTRSLADTPHYEKTQFRCHLDFFRLSKINSRFGPRPKNASGVLYRRHKCPSTVGISFFRRFLRHSFELHRSGDDRARTDNLRLARAALSQLSYVPGVSESGRKFVICNLNSVVGVGGLEPPTSALSEPHSNQLSYTPSQSCRLVTID